MGKQCERWESYLRRIGPVMKQDRGTDRIIQQQSQFKVLHAAAGGGGGGGAGGGGGGGGAGWAGGPAAPGFEIFPPSHQHTAFYETGRPSARHPPKSFPSSSTSPSNPKCRDRGSHRGTHVRCRCCLCVDTLRVRVDLQPFLGHLGVSEELEWHPDQMPLDLVQFLADFAGRHVGIVKVALLEFVMSGKEASVVCKRFDWGTDEHLIPGQGGSTSACMG